MIQPFMTNGILIVTALESELNFTKFPENVRGIYCGVGKLNAALAITKAIYAQPPGLIINFGTAGKINPGLSGLVEISTTIQRDMMAEPLAPRGCTPFSSEPSAYFSSQVASSQGGYVCATGDSFVTGGDPWLLEKKVDLVDMELFAIAKAAGEFGIPWRAFKYITDEANEASAEEWRGKVNFGEELFLLKFTELFRE